MPCRASNALEHTTENDGDATFRNSTPTRGTSINITFQNPTQRTLGIPTSHNPLHKNLMDLAFHNSSPRVKGCTNNAYGNNGDHAKQSHSKQKNMRKNGNWDNISLKLTMESIEMGNNL
jgi:hypothetical protein